ncbi:MAG TPA: multidrug efflux RND transporter permease subunit [Minicystis sp.]|nr:multidrug efflux RND transporter permease subunit [Minicystis sp.]
MNVSAVFIKRPIATALLAVAVLLAGAVAFRLLPVSPLPRVDFPTISVSASLPGASPETMASAVATPLERRFGRIAGVTEITSTSSLGATNITLQFDLDRDVDAAARDVQAAIAAAGGELPTNLPFRPSYRKVNPSDSPILILSLTSDVVPLAQVFESANAILAQKISQLDGVGQVTVGGGQQPAVRVQLDPEALAGVGLGTSDVRAALASSTVDQPKGKVSGSARASTIGANDQLLGAAAYKDLVIAYKDGAPVRLSDVADVFDDVENDQVAAWTSGVRSVLMIIRRQPGANIIETNERVKAVLPQLVKSIPAGINVEVAFDRTQTIRASVEDVESTLVASVVLVVLVVFVFLRSGRATVIPSVAVPLSLVATFGVMYLLGYSLDNLSLMALTISTGFVVDDAIVVTENIARYIELGHAPREAALLGAKQIGFTIVSITVSLLAVFIPILLMGGIVGRLFREFAVTLSVAVAVSAIVSLTLTPMMCSQLLRHDAGGHGKAYRATEAVFEWMLRRYDAALGWVLDHQRSMQLVTLLTVLVTVALFVVIPKGLFPQQDTGLLIGFSEAPQDVSFRSMRKRQMRLNEALKTDPDIGHAVSFIGRGNGSAGNTGTVFIELRQKPARKASAEEVIARLRPKLAKIEGVKLFLQAVQDVRVGGRLTRTQYQYTLQDADLEELRAWAPKLLAKLKTLRELKDVNSDQQSAGLSLAVDVDRDTASRLGLTPQMIDDALYDALGQRQVATMYSALNQYRVVMEVKPGFRATPDDLRELYVKSPTGGLVPLPAVATFKPSTTSLSITHQGQFPSITLSFNLAPGVSLGEAVLAVHAAELDIGMPPSVHGGFSGTAEAFQASLRTQPYLIAAALLAVYIVLGMLYESLVHPVTILSTLPSAGVGALLALLLFGTEFSVIALIGIILLIGIVKKNAIMMIDFALEVERDEGLAPREAIHRACVLRFRPIMMTTLAALFAGLPLAFGRGMGSELRRPLGIAIVGGLLVSQMLTLFTTPVIYLLLDRFRARHPSLQQATTGHEKGPPDKFAPVSAE